jgi:hypothetical protein
MSRIIEAPNEYEGSEPSLFLAGGITGTIHWQAEVVRRLADTPLVLLNPRRINYPWHDPSAAEAQIRWEYRYLRRASAVLFWFPSETLCPIALFELGGRIATSQPIFAGTHPNYPRRADVEIQLKLARPEIRVAHELAELTDQVRKWIGM